MALSVGIDAVVFDTDRLLMVPTPAALTGPTDTPTLVATGPDGLIDASLLPESGDALTQLAQRTVTDTTVMTYADGAIWADATNAAFGITLPDATTVTGQSFLVKKIDSTDNAVTLYPGNGQTIDGAATVELSVPESFIRFQSNGTIWYVTDHDAVNSGGGSASIEDIGVNEIPYSENIVIDLSICDVILVHVDGPVTASQFVNPAANQTFTVFLQQGGSGNNPFTWPTGTVNAATVAANSASTAVNTIARQTFTYLSQSGTYVAVTEMIENTPIPNSTVPRVNKVTCAADLVIDLTLADVIQLPLTTEVTRSQLTNPRPKQRVTVAFKQPSGGSVAFAWPGNCWGAADVSSVDPDSVCVQSFVYVTTMATLFAEASMAYSSAAQLAAMTAPGTVQLTIDVTGMTDVYIPLSANVASSAFTGLVDGQRLRVFLVQDSVGGHSFAWPSNSAAGGTISTAAGTANPNAVCVQEFVYLVDFGGLVAASPLFYE